MAMNVQKIFQSLHDRNKASVRVTDSQQVERLAEELGAQHSQLSPVGLVKSHGHFAGTDYFKEGLITIQDETSQLVAPTLDIQGDEIILDACATGWKDLSYGKLSYGWKSLCVGFI